jgi:TetR/AcrR family transcriptional regulator, mexJK operon transcriptional repressor
MSSESGLSPQSETSSRAIRKREAILEAAKQIFFDNGYVGTSMDKVAAKAAVSKQTVYKHFGSKDELFRAVVSNIVRAREAGITAAMLTTGDGSFEEGLCSFARFFLKGVMQVDVLRLRRLVIGESARFPELGATFYELGPERGVQQLATALSELSVEYGMELHDPVIAAEQLFGLILSIPLERAMLLGDDHGLSESALEHYADDGVRTFLRANAST